MKHFFTIFGHELRMLLVSPGTYIAAVLFLMLMGFIFAGILENYSVTMQEVSPASVFFQLFWIPVLFMVPLLTMKCLAEERRLGTLETLLTTPVTTGEVVFAKYAAAWLLYTGLWVSTGGFFWILHRFARASHFIDYGSLAGGYIYVAISGMLFVAIGVLASSLFRSQAVAAIVAFAILFAVIVGLRYAAGLELLKPEAMAPVRQIIDYAQIFQHQEDFTRGVVETRQILFYLSGTALALILSVLGVEARQLHS
ncbi:hypothetical protein OpiT1DRAFT_03563 [Opitutaceae bacterium TAV1]|nr:hypothetical protein OPIT5_12800 [Opitutaceae bacterium TAV5]EIP99059.1 hypothetical protein OpiT1DRAFT_03563 [Opitutaceae bacterium TAV1]